MAIEGRRGRAAALRAALSGVGLPVSRRAWREIAYALAVLVPGLAGLLLVPLLGYGGLLSVTFFGPPFLSLVLLATRGLTGLHRFLVRTLLGLSIAAAPRAQRPVTDGNAWRGAVFAVVAAPLAALLFAVQLPVRLYALVAVAYPFWYRAVEGDAGRRGIAAPGDVPLDTLPRALAVAAAGLALLALAAWAGRRLTALVRLLARTLLGAGPTSDRIHDLEETRALAVRDSAATLRRIERDLHDGAQARLVAVAMALTRAQEALDPERADAERARGLVDESLANARTALGELRDLVRGIHPPVLDSGLDAALVSLASSMESPAIRVRVHTDLPERPPEAVETIAYFCTAELVTNATRHASATAVDIAAELRAGVLYVTVRDDGTGGAEVGAGSGLSGLTERVRTIDGSLSLDSPPGGPTVATVTLPVPPHMQPAQPKNRRQQSPAPEEAACAS